MYILWIYCERLIIFVKTCFKEKNMMSIPIYLDFWMILFEYES